MAPLSRELRRSLENTVREARRVAEGGARKVIEQLAVHHHEPYTNMTPEQRELRNALRAHGRQLGDRRDTTRGIQAIDRLTTECAYEHWHRMLFARFLAETNLLIEPESGMDITLEDCQELARERGEDWLELASQFAERMLPQIFRTNDPVLKIALPPETRSELEKLLEDLSRDVFVADDSLGWVYQFWQADKKDEVNRSEKKIGAGELPAVTQLFTEDYMVFFLLHNTLGAWWAGKILAAKPELADFTKSEDEVRAACAVGGVDWTYLRFIREGTGLWRPAAGCFQGWPKAAKDITVLDPCMGSGHFLVFAMPMLAALRAEEEGLSAEAAVEAVLRDNLFGLEIDPRCTQIAAFNLALAAWRRVGYRQLPALHLACSGLSLGVTQGEWLKLTGRVAQALPVPPRSDLLGVEENLFSDATRRGFERLYDLFARAPWLGSLIDPRASGGDLVERSFADLEPVLAQVLSRSDSVDVSEMAVAAQGLAKAWEILARRFTLVTTNVPYLGRGKQDSVLKDFCNGAYSAAKADLATCFVQRCLDFCEIGGSAALVTPQNWLFLGTYKRLRKTLLEELTWNAVARLGAGAFETIGGEVVNVALLVLTRSVPSKLNALYGLECSDGNSVEAKSRMLRVSEGIGLNQLAQLDNPETKIVLENLGTSTATLEDFAFVCEGLHTGDYPRFGRNFWELPSLSGGWAAQEAAPEGPGLYEGKHYALYWQDGSGDLIKFVRERLDNEVVTQWIKGMEAWGKRGIAISAMGDLRPTLYTGALFTHGAYAIVPKNEADLPAIWAYAESGEMLAAVRRLDQKVCVARKSVAYIPYDNDRWHQVAGKRSSNGLPSPNSDDATQWLFSGFPNGAAAALQVGIARLVGYRWPRQTGTSVPDCPPIGRDGLEKHCDADGIVALNPVKGEQAAATRLISLLADAFGKDWSAARLDSLLEQVGFAGGTLVEWLCDGFFQQHCALFHQRPFVWQVWDGRRDGFHAYVNYHRLAASNGEGKRTLEKLIYTYLGDWIDRQRADQQTGVDGADSRLAAAEHLKSELVRVLDGEPPYDIFVRWKSLHEQSIGWEPDTNDGVRMNIRPFLAAKPLGARAKGACILRTTPKIKWDKDRGKEPTRPKEGFPWLWGWDEVMTDFPGGRTFDGNRWNDLHYSRAFKETARARSKK